MDEMFKAKWRERVHKRLTWAMLAELGIERPTLAEKPSKVYTNCLKCKTHLGNYAKGLCNPCYQSSRNVTRRATMLGEGMSVYGRPVCYCCGDIEAMTAQIPGTEKWVCCEHDTAAKREAFQSAVK